MDVEEEVRGRVVGSEREKGDGEVARRRGGVVNVRLAGPEELGEMARKAYVNLCPFELSREERDGAHWRKMLH